MDRVWGRGSPSASFSNGMDINSTVLAVNWVEFGIASLVILLRLVAQMKVLRRLSADDIIIFIAWFCHTLNASFLTVSIFNGLGHPKSALTEPEFLATLKYSTVAETFGVFCGMFARISFAIFLILFFTSTCKKLLYFLCFIIGLQVVANVTLVIMTWVECQPLGALFSTRPKTCWPLRTINIAADVTGALNAFTDFSLTLSGIALVWLLNIQWRTKIICMFLVSLSILATVTAILGMVEVPGILSDDPSCKLAYWAIWYLTENTVIMITSSIPKLRPLIAAWREKPSRRLIGQPEQDPDSLIPDGELEFPSPYKPVGTLFRRNPPSSGPSSSDGISFIQLPSYPPQTRMKCTGPHSIVSDGPRQDRYTARPSRLHTFRSYQKSLPSFSGRSCRYDPNNDHTRCFSAEQGPVDRRYNFIPANSYRMTSRTVVSVGGPHPPSIPDLEASNQDVPELHEQYLRNTARGKFYKLGRRSVTPSIAHGDAKSETINSDESIGFHVWRTKDFLVRYESVEEHQDDMEISSVQGSRKNDRSTRAIIHEMETSDTGSPLQRDYHYGDQESQILSDEHERAIDLALPPQTEPSPSMDSLVRRPDISCGETNRRHPSNGSSVNETIFQRKSYEFL